MPRQHPPTKYLRKSTKSRIIFSLYTDFDPLHLFTKPKPTTRITELTSPPQTNKSKVTNQITDIDYSKRDSISTQLNSLIKRKHILINTIIMFKAIEFYKFSNEGLSTTFQVGHSSIDIFENNKRVSGYDGSKILRAEYGNIKFPITFIHDRGSKLRDILDTGWSNFYLISDRLKKILDDNQFTGYKTFEVKVKKKLGEIITGYNGLSITGRSGAIDWTNGERFMKRLVPNGPLEEFVKGITISIDRWDGSDIFIPDGSNMTVVSEKVYKALIDEKFTNLNLLNCKDLEIWSYIADKKYNN
jgi:hypothetical protein